MYVRLFVFAKQTVCFVLNGPASTFTQTLKTAASIYGRMKKVGFHLCPVFNEVVWKWSALGIFGAANQIASQKCECTGGAIAIVSIAQLN